MKGSITALDPENRRGTITDSFNKSQYFFSEKYNLAPKTSFEDLSEGTEVEFDIKISLNNKRFANNIRLTAQVNHQNGSFNEFLFLNTKKLTKSIMRLAPKFFASCDPNDSQQQVDYLYKSIAEHYNILRNDAFDISEEACVFSSGIHSEKDDAMIFLQCKPGNYTQPWYCEDVICNGVLYTASGIFNDTVNADWYNIANDLKKYLDKTAAEFSDEKPGSIIGKITDRCENNTELVWLLKGKVCTKEKADELYVPTGYYESGGEELYLFCTKRKGIKGHGWYYNNLTYKNAPFDKVYEKKFWLEKWGGALDAEDFKELKKKTLEEKWDFRSEEAYGILDNYLRYTFAYQYKKNKIGYSNDKKYAAFNTGLPSRISYDFLYAFFEKAPEKEELHPLYFSNKYVFKGFVEAGNSDSNGRNGKILSENIKLPEPPQYFTSRSDTVWKLEFNGGNNITLPEFDDSHILIQRCDRIPLEFYKRYGFASEGFMSIFAQNVPDGEKYKQIREFLAPMRNNDYDDDVHMVYQELRSQLKNVITNAVKRLSWNWRAVVPCYNPDNEMLCFLLPVHFIDQGKPDRAMIASANIIDDKQVYQIHTVIPLNWAYLDARLVCRPESEWLAVGKISNEK